VAVAVPSGGFLHEPADKATLLNSPLGRNNFDFFILQVQDLTHDHHKLRALTLVISGEELAHDVHEVVGIDPMVRGVEFTLSCKGSFEFTNTGLQNSDLYSTGNK
jgi:hypothetical protein